GLTRGSKAGKRRASAVRTPPTGDRIGADVRRTSQEVHNACHVSVLSTLTGMDLLKNHPIARPSPSPNSTGPRLLRVAAACGCLSQHPETDDEAEALPGCY